MRSGNRGQHRAFAMALGETTDEAFSRFLTETIRHLRENLVDGGVAMVCMDWRHTQDLIAAVKAAGLVLINLCFRSKTNGVTGSLYCSKHEINEI